MKEGYRIVRYQIKENYMSVLY